MSEVVRAHVFVSGRVQGVFFRASAAQKANQLGVHGWVRNVSGGRVEAIFEGERSSVEAAIGWCRTGPDYADVSSVEVTWEPPAGDVSFAIR